mmetsp:Transcript_12895/g.31612  ORF Transcript_12895/g.31612 Transcript_12895/m.31612 type:complete len:123 (+) Transcript_12895:470-838(+)
MVLESTIQLVIPTRAPPLRKHHGANENTLQGLADSSKILVGTVNTLCMMRGWGQSVRDGIGKGYRSSASPLIILNRYKHMQQRCSSSVTCPTVKTATDLLENVMPPLMETTGKRDPTHTVFG